MAIPFTNSYFLPVGRLSEQCYGFDSLYMDHFVYASSQWETTLHCKVVSHCLGANTKWSLSRDVPFVPRFKLGLADIIRHNDIRCLPPTRVMLYSSVWNSELSKGRELLNFIASKHKIASMAWYIVEYFLYMMTSSNGDIFRDTGLLCGEVTGDRWIPRTKASDAEIWFFFICVWTSGSVNNIDAGDLRRRRAHYDVIVIKMWKLCLWHMDEHEAFLWPRTLFTNMD